MFSNRFAVKPDLVPAAGQRVQVQLDGGVKTLAVQLRLTGIVTVTTPGAAGTLRNRGSILALVNRLGINVDGEDRIIGDARAMRALTAIAGRDASKYVRLADAAAAAAYNLEETVIVPCTMPGLSKPEELALSELDPRIGAYVFAEGLNAQAALAGGAFAATITNLKAKVTHIYDSEIGSKPLLRPQVREIVQVIAAAGDYEIPLRGSKYVAALLIQQDTDAGEATDVVNTVQLMGDDNRSFMPQPAAFADVSRLFGVGDSGAMIGGDSYALINFVGFGRLSKQVHPLSVNNFRLRLNAQPSALAGATASRVRVLVVESEHDPVLTVPPDALPFTI